jgi:DNA-binding XRE family transcriptional regulator
MQKSDEKKLTCMLGHGVPFSLNCCVESMGTVRIQHRIRTAKAGAQPSAEKNALKQIRERLMMSKAELARKANLSPITIARIEDGMPCRMETQRKILLALGFDLSDKDKIFGT